MGFKGLRFTGLGMLFRVQGLHGDLHLEDLGFRICSFRLSALQVSTWALRLLVPRIQTIGFSGPKAINVTVFGP